MNENTMKKLYYSLLSLLWTGAFFSMIYIQYYKLYVASAFILCLVYAIGLLLQGKKEKKNLPKGDLSPRQKYLRLFFLLTFFLLLLLVFPDRSLFLFYFIILFRNLFYPLYKKIFSAPLHILKKIGICLSTLPILLLIIGICFYFRKPLLLSIFPQLKGENIENIESHRKIIEKGVTLYSDVFYESTLPNSYMDIYVSPKTSPENPTIFIVHGGGYIGGDKISGDPNGNSANDGILQYYYSFLDNGYNVVAINYALAPEYSYPTPLIQLNDSINYLKKHHKEYGITMDALVFSGSSAGGQIVGQFLNMQLNDDYRQKIGMEKVLEKDTIKGVIFNSAILSGSLKSSGSLITDLIFNDMRRYYLYYFDDINAFEKRSLSIGLLENLGDSFIPTYIDDGAINSFANQARDLHEKLSDMGVYNELYIVENAAHSFEFATDENAKKNLERQIAFVKKLK